jgi:hypothetical protein
VTGVCAECGSAVTFVAPRKMLGIQTFCRDCFRTIEFNLYEMQEYSGHYQWLCAELQKTNRLAIVGTKTEATNLLKYDYFKLNYRSLAAFVEIDKKASGIPDFCHLPRIRMEGLPAMKPDTLLIVDDQFGNAELKIRNFYLKKNLRPPRILHLLPDNKRPYSKVIGFMRNHTSPTIPNKYSVALLIQLPLFISGAKEWILKFIKSNYFVLIRVKIFRMLLEKMRQ